MNNKNPLYEWIMKSQVADPNIPTQTIRIGRHFFGRELWLSMAQCKAIGLDDGQTLAIVSEPEPPMTNSKPKCQHLHTIPGPSIPRVYGSGPTVICSNCGCWRPDWGLIGSEWRPASTLKEAMERDADQ